MRKNTSGTVKVPAADRSRIGFCPRGQMGGHRTTVAKLERFAQQTSRKMIDEVIPLDQPEQASPKSCPNVNHEGDSMIDKIVYWETEDGMHGWCCEECGTVTQWG